MVVKRSLNNTPAGGAASVISLAMGRALKPGQVSSVGAPNVASIMDTSSTSEVAGNRSRPITNLAKIPACVHVCEREKGRGEGVERRGKDDAVMVITAHAPHIHGQRVVRVPEQDFGRTVAERHDSRGA
jgi:hypothetical protein